MNSHLNLDDETTPLHSTSLWEVVNGLLASIPWRLQFQCRFSCLTPGLDWTRLFMSLTAGAGTRCMSLLPDSPTLS